MTTAKEYYEERRNVGADIRRRRESLGMTQERLADLVGVPQSHVSRLECGKHTPTFTTIQRIDAVLDVANASRYASGRDRLMRSQADCDP